MKTIALKIDENTPEGRAFLTMTDVFIKSHLGVELAGSGESAIQMIGEVISRIKNKAPKAVRTLDDIIRKEKKLRPSFS